MRAADEKAGQRLKCPRCRQSFSIPSGDQVSKAGEPAAGWGQGPLDESASEPLACEEEAGDLAAVPTPVAGEQPIAPIAPVAAKSSPETPVTPPSLKSTPAPGTAIKPSDSKGSTAKADVPKPDAAIKDSGKSDSTKSVAVKLGAVKSDPAKPEAAKRPFVKPVAPDRATSTTPSTTASTITITASETRQLGADVDPRRLAIPRWLVYVQGGLLAGVATAAFVAGLLIGRQPAADVARTSPAAAAPTRLIELAGQLTYKSPAGEVPDKDAAVIVMPMDKLPPRPLAPIDLIPQRPAPKDDHAIVKAIRDLGGEYARSSDTGQFFLYLPPGKYHVWLLSHSTERPPGIMPRPEDALETGKYFHPPDVLFGKQKYRFSTLELQQPSAIKHFFGESGKL